MQCNIKLKQLYVDVKLPSNSDLIRSIKMKKFEEMTHKELEKCWYDCVVAPLMKNLTWYQRIDLKIYSLWIKLIYKVGYPLRHRC